MHTGKEGTEAMPYFDTFDLETIDILLISQYVLSFSFFVSAAVDKHLEESGFGFSNNEDSKTKMTTPRDSPLLQESLLKPFPGHRQPVGLYY